MSFNAFPSIPHLAWLGQGTPRGDKVLSATDVERFLAQPLLVEEKVDGANLGISFDTDGSVQVQNRGGYLLRPWSGQFAKLEAWLSPRLDSLFDMLGNERILFGEWCAVRHSVLYDQLPDWFPAFDVYDRPQGRFLSLAERGVVVERCGVATVPEFDRGRFRLQDLTRMLASVHSHYYAGPPEGFVLRPLVEPASAETPVRAKLVRAEFAQAIEEHWRGRLPEPNRLAAWQAPMTARHT